MSEEVNVLRNNFYMGAFTKVFEEAKGLTDLDTKTQALRDVFIHRSNVALGRFSEVQRGIDKKNAPIALQAVKLWALYRESVESESSGTNTNASAQRELVFNSLAEWLGDSTMAQDQVLRLMAAQIYLDSLNYKEALKLVHNGEGLELKALCVQIYLKIDRLDLAEKALKSMTDTDDDDPLTTLASVWVNIAQGGEKVSQAFELLQELVDRFGPTILLLNLQAVCQIFQKNFTEAFGLLKTARETALQSHQKVSAETLINSIICLQHLKKPQQVIEKILGEFKQTHPGHPWLKHQEELNEAFSKCASSHT